MRILIAHNRYREAGGEDNVVEAERALLSQHGHDVDVLLVDNRDLADGILTQIKTAFTATYSRIGREKLRETISISRPDIVHVHNFFPQLSPSIYDACADEGVAVVQTLHNFRLICPGALLMRDGKICEQCITGSPYQAALYGCYRNSRPGSLAVAHMVATHRRLGTWSDKVDRFIALTDFAKSKFLQGGIPEDRMNVKSNFVLDPQTSTGFKKRDDWESRESFALFVGRLSPEKGFVTLSKAWLNLDRRHTLKIAGSGPLESELPDQHNIMHLGFQQKDGVSFLMSCALFLIVPSECFENFPMVIAEAFAHGLPVLASRLGSMGEVIEDGVTGVFFEPGDYKDLASKACWLLERPAECKRMGENARNNYVEKYSPEVNYPQLLNIYREAMDHQRSKRYRG
jgi:glycosyltransferase involved in cell wall biosynthesis